MLSVSVIRTLRAQQLRAKVINKSKTSAAIGIVVMLSTLFSNQIYPLNQKKNFNYFN